MAKYLYITFSNLKETWRVDAEKIAKDRAEYYVKRDIEDGYVSLEDKEKAVETEMKVALEDEYEIIDWAQGNMNWDDLLDFGLQLHDRDRDYEVDYDQELIEADFEVGK